MVMQEKGGWENRDVVEAFGRTRKRVLLFGDRVKHWFTLCRPGGAGGRRLFVRLPISQLIIGFLNVRPPWRTAIPC